MKYQCFKCKKGLVQYIAAYKCHCVSNNIICSQCSIKYKICGQCQKCHKLYSRYQIQNKQQPTEINKKFISLHKPVPNKDTIGISHTHNKAHQTYKSRQENRINENKSQIIQKNNRFINPAQNLSQMTNIHKKADNLQNRNLRQTYTSVRKKLHQSQDYLKKSINNDKRQIKTQTQVNRIKQIQFKKENQIYNQTLDNKLKEEQNQKNKSVKQKQKYMQKTFSSFTQQGQRDVYPPSRGEPYNKQRYQIKKQQPMKSIRVQPNQYYDQRCNKIYHLYQIAQLVTKEFYTDNVNEFRLPGCDCTLSRKQLLQIIKNKCLVCRQKENIQYKKLYLKYELLVCNTCISDLQYKERSYSNKIKQHQLQCLNFIKKLIYKCMACEKQLKMKYLFGKQPTGEQNQIVLCKTCQSSSQSGQRLHQMEKENQIRRRQTQQAYLQSKRKQKQRQQQKKRLKQIQKQQQRKRQQQKRNRYIGNKRIIGSQKNNNQTHKSYLETKYKRCESCSGLVFSEGFEFGDIVICKYCKQRIQDQQKQIEMKNEKQIFNQISKDKNKIQQKQKQINHENYPYQRQNNYSEKNKINKNNRNSHQYNYNGNIKKMNQVPIYMPNYKQKIQENKSLYQQCISCNALVYPDRNKGIQLGEAVICQRCYKNQGLFIKDDNQYQNKYQNNKNRIQEQDKQINKIYIKKVPNPKFKQKKKDQTIPIKQPSLSKPIQQKMEQNKNEKVQQNEQFQFQKQSLLPEIEDSIDKYNQNKQTKHKQQFPEILPINKLKQTKLQQKLLKQQSKNQQDYQKSLILPQKNQQKLIKIITNNVTDKKNNQTLKSNKVQNISSLQQQYQKVLSQSLIHEVNNNQSRQIIPQKDVSPQRDQNETNLIQDQLDATLFNLNQSQIKVSKFNFDQQEQKINQTQLKGLRKLVNDIKQIEEIRQSQKQISSSLEINEKINKKILIKQKIQIKSKIKSQKTKPFIKQSQRYFDEQEQSVVMNDFKVMENDYILIPLEQNQNNFVNCSQCNYQINPNDSIVLNQNNPNQNKNISHSNTFQAIVLCKMCFFDQVTSIKQAEDKLIKQKQAQIRRSAMKSTQKRPSGINRHQNNYIRPTSMRKTNIFRPEDIKASDQFKNLGVIGKSSYLSSSDYLNEGPYQLNQKSYLQQQLSSTYQKDISSDIKTDKKINYSLTGGISNMEKSQFINQTQINGKKYV